MSASSRTLNAPVTTLSTQWKPLSSTLAARDWSSAAPVTNTAPDALAML